MQRTIPSREELSSVINTASFMIFEEVFVSSYPHTGHFDADRADWSTWSKHSMCFELAFGVVYPMMRLLHPTLPLRIWIGESHCFVVSQHNIYDPMHAAGTQQERALYETEQPVWEDCVPEDDIAEFWTTQGAEGLHDTLTDLLSDLYE